MPEPLLREIPGMTMRERVGQPPMKFVWVLLVAICVSTGGGTIHRDPSQTAARIVGIVTDFDGGRVPDVEIHFRGVQDQRRIRTKDNGSYSIDLAPGVYAAEIVNKNFCPLHRGKFLATTTSEMRIDFQLWICASDSSGTYNFVELDSVKNTDLRPLVLYGRVCRNGDRQIFTGAILGRIYPVVFTFNLLTVEADELTYDRTNHVVTARGNVSWQDGNTSASASQLSVKLDGLKPQLLP
jgi:hypothetical protein